MTVDALLSRLDGVKRTGPGRWLARCPAHDDKHPSLAVREVEDGRILLHDFAGCAIEDVVSAIGLTLSDVMPERSISDHVKPERRAFFPADVFDIALREITIATVISCDLHKNRAIDDAGYERLLTACGRLNGISEAAYAK